MRYRITFETQAAVEIEANDLRLRTQRSVSVTTSPDVSRTVDVLFGEEIKRIADDHDHTVYRS